jgi:hypothetical protein
LNTVFWVIRTSVVVTAALRATGFALREKMRRVPTHRTLCAIARTVIEQDRAMNDAEWKERTKCRLVSQGWAYPTPLELGAALAAVERALAKQWGPRPVEIPAKG